MDWYEIIWVPVIVWWTVHTLIRAYRLERAALIEGVNVKVNFLPLWDFITFKNQWRKAEREWICEQERVRKSGQQLCSGGDGGENFSDGLGGVGVVGSYGGQAGFGQLSDDDFRRVASPFDDRFDGCSED